jgi:hypothetical protein
MTSRLLAGLSSFALAIPAVGAEITSTAQDRSALTLSVYNSDMAVVTEHRNVTLPGGNAVLALTDLPSQLRPATVRLSGPRVRMIESRFAYDLLTPDSLMQHFVGREVTLVRTNPANGAEESERGQLLSVAGGVPVFRVRDRVETGGPQSPWRVTFGALPEGLRAEPTLTATLETGGGGRQPLDLTYITGGLSWSTDYVAEFDENSSTLQLAGWASLTNNSGGGFEQARLRLVAGDVNRVANAPIPMMYKRGDMAMAAEASAPPEAAAGFEYYVYDFEQPVNLADQETKQLPLVPGASVKVEREYRLDASRGMGWRYFDDGQQRANAVIQLNFRNTFGRPLPAGTVRVYAADKDARVPLLGEDSIRHTPLNEEIELTLGQAFDVTARRVQLKQEQLANNRFEATWQVKVKNAKKRDVEVKVIEPMPGDWTLAKASHEHRRLDANRVEWTLKVPAGGETTLEYRVSWK